ncbi:hypothetical protein [Streptomyces sp. NPDC006267]
MSRTPLAPIPSPASAAPASSIVAVQKRTLTMLLVSQVLSGVGLARNGAT